MRLATTLALAFLLAPTALAQTPGTCEHGTAEADLDISDVRARLFNGGNLFFGNTTVSGDGYLVPKNSDHSPIFAAGIWIGGEVDGDPRVAAATYNNFEFWPGPLEQGATLPNPDDCSAYDRIWLVSAVDVQIYDDTGEATKDLADWPVELGAPVIDGDGVEGNYHLEGGDRPKVYGSQTAFWVMNDVGNEHRSSHSAPIGLEVRVTAFAISSEDPALDQSTFYRYRLLNRNTLPVEDARFGFFQDPDLGDAADDYHGVDTTRSFAFAYNAAANDAVYGIPPAFGIDFLGGLGVFSDPREVSPFDPPLTGLEMAHLLRGSWRDGTPITEGGSGYMSDGQVLTTLYPGDPVSTSFWSERNTDGSGGTAPPGDRRSIVASPPFTLAPDEARTFDLALLFAQGESNLDSITQLRAASDIVQAAYDDGSLFDTRFPVSSDGSSSTPSATRLGAVYPNPFARSATVPFEVAEYGRVRLAVYDVLGRQVAVLADGPVAAGGHEARFEAGGLPSGLYLVVLEAGGERQTRKVMLVR